MEGGPSHIDTFDPKPKLNELHMTEFAKERTKFAAAMNTGKRHYVKSPFEFQRVGELGIDVNTRFPHFANVVDDICFYRGLQAESVNHPTALYHLNTGNRFGGDPAVGSWVSYGLGTENENLPAFVVLPTLPTRRAVRRTGPTAFCPRTTRERRYGQRGLRCWI